MQGKKHLLKPTNPITIQGKNNSSRLTSQTGWSKIDAYASSMQSKPDQNSYFNCSHLHQISSQFKITSRVKRVKESKRTELLVSHLKERWQIKNRK
jgi:CRISPR/Cas system-associated endoribonuclease Cas2